MNCYYHETIEATKPCIQCKKALCNECFHSEYPEYCWSCGLDHDNRLGNAELDFQIPKWLENTIVFYILHKLFSALGSCFIFSIIMCVIFGFFRFDAILLFVGLLTSSIVYTYGIITSLLIDFAARYMKTMRVWYFNGGLYLLFGLLFPFIEKLNIVMPLHVGIDKPVSAVLGGFVALLFFMLQTIKMNKKLIILGGLVSFLLLAFFTMMILINR
ncbi:hypothetical protein [Cohnella mopanensis]|uniref:hypothetical protein n=1 Tax=Cohnella mopanensis TaxID=2911966 RepID=UPI001EF7D12B|nr:hypothetical protein [Cohnella mopanensis]